MEKKKKKHEAETEISIIPLISSFLKNENRNASRRTLLNFHKFWKHSPAAN